MYITVLATGSQIEIQPFLSLSVRLREAGHSVRIATHARNRDLVLDRGLDFSPLPDQLDAGLTRAPAPAAAELAQSPLGHAVYEAARDADLIMTAPALRPITEPLAEWLGIPLVYGPQRLVLRRRPSFPWRDQAVAV
jgi:sterol 3beta-glucosyltransferase